MSETYRSWLVPLVLCCGCSAPGTPVREPVPPPADHPPLDPDLVEDVRIALGSVEDPEQVLDVVSGALAELEKDRLPSPIVEALDAFRHVEEESVAELLVRAVEQTMMEWERVCEGGEKAFGDLQFLGAEEKSAFIYDACGFDRYGFIDSAVAAEAPVMRVVLAFLIYGTLELHGALENVEVELLESFVLGKWNAD